jgi:flavin-dependent dehydrogenase
MKTASHQLHVEFRSHRPSFSGESSSISARKGNTMRQTAQIGIVGAGPGGARAGELLAALGTSVVLLDPKVPWEKPCGGGLTPPALEEVPELGELEQSTRAIGRVRVEMSPEEGFSVDLDHPMWILSRKTLGRWQLERALAAGAVHLPAKVKSVVRSAGDWLVETDHGALRFPFLIGADGAASLVRRVASPRLSVELAPTRVAYPLDAGPAPDTVVLRFYGGIAGYLWDFPRPDHRSVGIGVPNGTWRRPLLDGEIDTYRDSSQPCDCPGLERAGAVIGTAQLGHGDFSRIAGPDFALLGDAAGFADPLTGEGIQNALRSAGLFARAWAAGEARLYPRLARRAFSREFAVARFVRRSVFESEAGLRLIERALVSDAAYAVVAATVNAVNEHDGSTLRFARRWMRTVRRVRAKPSTAGRTPRVAVPCACRSAGAHSREGRTCGRAPAAA